MRDKLIEKIVDKMAGLPFCTTLGRPEGAKIYIILDYVSILRRIFPNLFIDWRNTLIKYLPNVVASFPLRTASHDQRKNY